MFDLKVGIVIPTYNGGDIWKQTASILSLSKSSHTVLVIDSTSSDDTVDVALKHGFNVKVISSIDFNHGGTRNLGINELDVDIVVFLTQDAIPSVGCIEKIVAAFSDENIACAYGRQLPHKNANAIAAHARYYNYTENSYISNKSKVDAMGIKAVFMSNSFSAYRVSAFRNVGGFPLNTILCEDMYFAAKAILAGYSIAYVSDAQVHHSHNYTMHEEFSRYFDIGVFHSDEPWIRAEFGGAGGEGKKFIISEIKYLIKNDPKLIIKACANNFCKILGYKLGQKYKKLSMSTRIKFSMHKKYWKSFED